MKFPDFKKVRFYEGIRAEEGMVPMRMWEREMRSISACLWAGPEGIVLVEGHSSCSFTLSWPC